MSDEELNRKLAEVLGWEPLKESDGWSPSICASHMGVSGKDQIASPPKFCTDLNACHEVEKGLTEDQREKYVAELNAVLPCDENLGPINPLNPDSEDFMAPSQFTFCHASARKRRLGLLVLVPAALIAAAYFAVKMGGQ